MKKEDFHKGQTVWVYLTGNAARYCKTEEDRVREWEVISVGRKYITAKPKAGGWEEKFDIQNNFRHVYDRGTEDYILYLTKEEILKKNKRYKNIEFIEKCCRWDKSVHKKLSDEDLETVVEIFKRYTE